MSRHSFSIILAVGLLWTVSSTDSQAGSAGISTPISNLASKYTCNVLANGSTIEKKDSSGENQSITFGKARRKVKKVIKGAKNKLISLKVSLAASDGKKRKKFQKRIKILQAKLRNNKNLLRGVQKCQRGVLAPSFEATTVGDTGSIVHGENINVNAWSGDFSFHDLGNELSFKGVIDHAGLAPGETPGDFIFSGERRSNSENSSLHIFDMGGVFVHVPEEFPVLLTVKLDYSTLSNTPPKISVSIEATLSDGGTISLNGSITLKVFDSQSPGDLDQDGDVDIKDLNIFNSCLGQSATGECAGSDGNLDGTVGIDDHSLIFADGFESGDVSKWSNTIP